MRINNNIMALNAHRQLGVNQANASKSMERLSSGLRINRAGDDAAGLAISEKMRGQIRGLKQAARNAQDGISLIQTAEGALNETHAILQRMRELAVQASTDTNTKADRAEIQKEINQLASEITRIAETTEFNTQTLLDGKFNSIFHIGANEGQNVDLAVNSMTSKALGLETAGKFATDVIDGVIFETFDGEIKSVEIESADATGEDDNIDASIVDVKVEDGVLKLNVLNAKGDGVHLTEDALNAALEEFGVTVSGTVAAFTDGGKGEFVAKVEDVGDIKGAYANIADDKITSLTFKANSTATSGVVVTRDGGDISVLVHEDVTLEELNAELKAYGISIQSNNDEVNDDTAVGEIEDDVSMDIEAGNIPIRVDTQKLADKAITTINDALETVSAERSKLGAMQNRLEHTIANLGTSAENLQAAESRIRDLDMAEEIMAFTKNNILQQAATAMLAQANMAPQSVLQLLG
jgi:flagellin